MSMPWQAGPVGEGRSVDSPPKPRPVRSDGSIPKVIVIPTRGRVVTSTSVNGNGGSTQGTALAGVMDAGPSSSQGTAKPSPQRVPGAEPRPLRRCAKCKRDLPIDAYPSPRARRCEECNHEASLLACIRCRVKKPRTEFGEGQRRCSACMTRPSSDRATQPRTCLRCWKEKEPEEFSYTAKPRGKGKQRRRRSVCRKCWKRARDAKRRARIAREAAKNIWTTEEGVVMRTCSLCNVPKPLLTEFYVSRRRNGKVDYYTQCKKCSVERISNYQKRLADDPLTAAGVREQRREWQRKWRAANREKARDANRRYVAAIRQDPERWARKLESDRMGYALRRERAGLPRRISTKAKSDDILERSGYQTFLPSRPLVAALDVLIERKRKVRGRAVASRGQKSVEQDPPTTEVCDDAGIPPRSLYRWRHEGGDVRFTTADHVLTALNLLWWEVWKKPQERTGTGRPIDVLAWIDYAEEAMREHDVAWQVFEGDTKDDKAKER